MGYRLIFTINREAFRIDIENKKISYIDRKFNRLITLIPRDEDFIKKVICSRNKIPTHFIDLFNLTKEEQIEYDNAKTDEELAEVCIKDCRTKGAILLKKEII
jgi:hypothetical protein